MTTFTVRVGVAFLASIGLACGDDATASDAGFPDVSQVVPEWVSLTVAECEVGEIDRPADLLAPEWTACGEGCRAWNGGDRLIASQAGEGLGLLLVMESTDEFDIFKLVTLESAVVRAWRVPRSSVCEIGAASIYENALSLSVSVRRPDSLREEHFLIVYVGEGAWSDGTGRVEGVWATSAREFGQRVGAPLAPTEPSDIRYFRGEHLWEQVDGTIVARFGDDTRTVGRSPARPAVLNFDSQVVVLAEDNQLRFWHPALDAPETLVESDFSITAVEHARRLVWVEQRPDESVVWRDAETGLAYRPEFINAWLFDPVEIFRSDIELQDAAAGNPIRGLLVALIDSTTLRVVRDECPSATSPCIADLDIELPVEAEELLAVVAGPPVAALLQTTRGLAVVDLVEGG